MAKQLRMPGMRRLFTGLAHELKSISAADGMWGWIAGEVRPAHVADVPDRVDRETLFRHSVKMVEFEPHAFCNRTCSFCPNAVHDRRGVKGELDLDLYTRQLQALAAIGYREAIRFALFSEPLANPRTVEFVRLARAMLPTSVIEIVSNGDYLTAEMLDSLATAGLSRLWISIYPASGAWTLAAIEQRVGQLAGRLAIVPMRVASGDDHVASWRFPHASVAVVATAKNLETTGIDRGGNVPHLTDRAFVRHDPCPFVFRNVSVYFDGTVMPCCDLRADVPGNEPFAWGRLGRDGDLIDVYASSVAAGWRRSLAEVGAKGPPCRSCKHNILGSSLGRRFLSARLDSRR
ncbi:MAG: hypothetical protein HY985_09990 [Magnetospirillum sp.]|nr:hypothetical protein [Magnetospirillum sp.]